MNELTKIGIKGGFVVSALLITYHLILLTVSINTGNPLSEEGFVFWVLVVGLLYTIYEYKNINNSLLSIKEALRLGLIASAIAGFFNGVYQWVFIKFYDANLLTLIFKKVKLAFEDNPDYSKEEINMILSQVQSILTAEFVMISTWLSILLYGLVGTLILGMLLKKDTNDLSYSDYPE